MIESLLFLNLFIFIFFRLPFTRLKTIDEFRNDINNEMKNLLKMYRRRMKIETFFTDLKMNVCVQENLFINRN